jgi:hypothetical protein
MKRSNMRDLCIIGFDLGVNLFLFSSSLIIINYNVLYVEDLPNKATEIFSLLFWLNQEQD